MSRRLALVPLTSLSLALLLSGCGDDSGVVASATDSAGETTGPSTTTTTTTTTGDDETTAAGICSVNSQCEDGNSCTNNRCGNGACVAEPVLSNSCRPQIIVDYPPRGTTIVGAPGQPVVTVTGKAESAAGSIEVVTFNGEEVKFDDEGAFSVDMVVMPGGNTIDIEVVDVVGAKRRHVQSFLWSTEYRQPTTPGEQMVPEGLAFYLSQDALDDGDNTTPADDIATVLGIALANFDIAALLDPKTPITSTAGYDVYLTAMKFGSTKVTLAGIDGGLGLSAAIQEVDGDLYFDCTTPACILLGGDGTGGLSVKEIKVSAETMIWVDAQGQVQVTVMNPMTDLKADDVDIWSNNGWTNFLLTIIKPFIMGGIVNDIVSSLNDTLESQLGPALATALNTLEVDAFFDLPNLGGTDETIPVNLVTEFADTTFHDGVAPPDPSPPQSGTIIQRAGGYFTSDVTPYTNDGVPSRVGCAATDEMLSIPRTAEVEIALADDMINQVLYGAWRGGLLEFPVPPELAGEGDMLQINSFVASGMLAPTASDCATPGELRAHIGDLRFDGDIIVLGKPMTFTAFMTMVVRLEIAADGESIMIGVPEVVDIRTQLDANEDNMIDVEAFIAQQLEKGISKTILDALGGGGLGAINLPVIDLSAQLGLPPGTATLAITADSAIRGPGTTVIEAHF
ncbi:MAG: hypothetical protein R3B09_21965 [Nannocystaceae bacterium]